MVRDEQPAGTVQNGKVVGPVRKNEGPASEVAGVRSPSAWKPRLLIFGFALLDFLLATHLALYQWRIIDTVWDPVFQEGSRKVLDSAVSETFHDILLVPDAAVGAAAYLAEMLLALAGSVQRWRRWPWIVVLFGANAILVALAGAMLVVLQATVVHAWCLLCILTAIFSLPMPALAWRELRASIGYLQRR